MAKQPIVVVLLLTDQPTRRLALGARRDGAGRLRDSKVALIGEKIAQAAQRTPPAPPLPVHRAESHTTRDNARLAVAARGFGVPESNRVGLGAQPRVSYR